MVALARSISVSPNTDRLTHLDAVEIVLQRAQKPLTAKELAHLISAQSITAISGKTPWKTITARLSQDIIERGNSSPFMRTFHGRFALRGWDFEPEFEVPRRVVHPLDETIKVVPRGHFNAIIKAMARGEADPLDYSGFLQVSIAMNRRDAEQTLDVVQLIPTFVVERRNHYLTYRRTKRLPEARLHHAVCVNFGGHMQVEDEPILFMGDGSVIEQFLQRELYEELAFSQPPLLIKPEGVLYLQGSDFEKQHVGLCFRVHLSSDTHVESLEPGMHTDLRFVDKEVLTQETSQFDSWSKTLIEAL